MSLKLLWTDIGGVQYKGKGIIEAWRDEMAKKGWVTETDPSKWRDCDLIFYGSDSQLRHCSEPLGNKPTILYFWGWEPARLLDQGFKQVAYQQLQMMARCTRILVPSLVTMYQVADFGLPSYLCLPGVDTETLDHRDPHVAREPRVMFLSRLVPHKHLDALVHALSLLQPPPKLLAVGPGDTAPYAEMANRLGVEVEFRELTDEEKGTEITRSAVLVHPSEYEGFGLPPLEALYCGTPVVAFDIPQHRWLLQEDAYYFASHEGLARQIANILNDPTEALAKAAHGSERVKKSLTLEHACDRLWAHVHQVIKEYLAVELRSKPAEWARIYDDEHRRNWAYSVDRFDPTWERHWRAQSFIEALRGCNAQKVLDVGSGAVYPTIFARAGFKVTAADISQEAVRQVTAIAEKWGVGQNVYATVMDANRLEYRDETFDAVVQGELWEHVPDTQRVIREGLRVLKRGGYLVASTPMGEHHYDPMHLRVFDDASIAELLKPWEGMVKKLDKIAEEGTDPSCYLVVIQK